jgi:hypothetical protein
VAGGGAVVGCGGLLEGDAVLGDEGQELRGVAGPPTLLAYLHCWSSMGLTLRSQMTWMIWGLSKTI